MKKSSKIWSYSMTIMLLFINLTNSCKKNDNTCNPTFDGTVKNIKGNVYNTVTIW